MKPKFTGIGIAVVSAIACGPGSSVAQESATEFASLCSTPPVEEVGPGVVSTDAVEYGPAFTPSGDTIFFTRRTSFRDPPAIVYSVRGADGWSTPERLRFTSELGDEYPSVSPDGRGLYFASRRPHPHDVGDENSMWRSELVDGAWADPTPIVFPAAQGATTSHPVEAWDGSLYFHGRLPGAAGVDAYRLHGGASHADGTVDPLPFNSPSIDGEVVLAPDLTWLVFYSDRDGGMGNGDLYGARAADGGWDTAVNLGATVNTAAWEWTPSIDHSGTTLYFARLNEAFDRSDICAVPASSLDGVP